MKNWIIWAVVIGLIIIGVMAFANKPIESQNIQLDNGSTSSAEFKWHTDLNQSIKEAEKTNKPIFALFYANWCPACQELQTDILNNEEVKQKLAQKYVSVKVDTDSNPQLSSEYEIYGLPTIVIMDSKGKETVRYAGYQSPDQLLNVL